MTAVRYALADFNTGGRIVDLPVMPGAEWATQLNRPDAVACKIDMRDPDTLRLDLRSSTEPNKTILFAETDDTAGVILAWGLIGDDGREWDEDAQTLSLTARGVEDAYFGQTIIAPATCLSADLITNDAEGFPQVNPALNTTLTGWSHGTIGKKLVAQRLAWPGSPTAFVLPADEPGTREEEYFFSEFKMIGKALADLTGQEVGPDFAFVAQRAASGIAIEYHMLHGSEAQPRLGTEAGIWKLGEGTPIVGLKTKDLLAAGASAGWMSAGRQAGTALISRRLNATMLANGYPAFDIVDTSHSDVKKLVTLNSYNAANMREAAVGTRDISFSVRGDAPGLSLGQYRPGDVVTLDVPADHPWLTRDIKIRLTSLKGNETGEFVQIGCVIVNG